MDVRLRVLAAAAAIMVAFAPRSASPQSRAAANPPSQGATVVDLFALSDLSGPIRPKMVLSPDGRMLALFERRTDLAANAYAYDLLVIDLDCGEVRRIAEAGDVILRSANGRRSGAPIEREPVWGPDQSWIYYLTSRERRVEVWRARSDGGGDEPVVQGDANVRRFALINGGATLAFEMATPQAQSEAERAREDAVGFRIDDNFDAMYALRPLLAEEAGARIVRRTLATGAETEGQDSDFTALSPDQSARIAPLDPTSRVAKPALGLFTNLGGQELRCSDAACGGQLEEAWVIDVDPGSEIIFRRLEGFARQETALYAWRPDTQSVRLLRRAREKLEGCVVSGQTLLCLQEAALQPRRLVRIDASSGELKILYDPNPQWQALRRPRVEELRFSDRAGVSSFADLVYPLNYRHGRLYPMVIVQYRSRGFLRAGTGDETPILPLSTLGYFVLSVDRPEFEARAAQLSLGDLQIETELDDTEHAAKREAILDFVRQATERGLVDPHRIGITGLSDGAETVYDMLADAPIFAAAVASSPPTDPIGWALLPQSFRDRQREQAVAAPWDQSAPQWIAWWRENTTSNHVGAMRAPLMLNLSETEALRAFPLIAHINESDLPLETYIYPGAYHLKWRPSQIQAAQYRTIAWFEFWLRGRNVNDADDPQRTARWTAMRERAQSALGAPH